MCIHAWLCGAVYCSRGEWRVWRRHLRASEGSDWGAGGTVSLGSRQPATLIASSVPSEKLLLIPNTSLWIIVNLFNWFLLFWISVTDKLKCNVCGQNHSWPADLNTYLASLSHCTIDHMNQRPACMLYSLIQPNPKKVIILCLRRLSRFFVSGDSKLTF